MVFYAREDLQLGAGFGGAIRSRGGPTIQQELDGIGRVAVGNAVVTSAGTLRARHVIHTCGPKFHERDLAGNLRKCMDSALRAAADLGMRTVAFPPMGAGFYGVPLPMCATVMIEAMREFLSRSSSLEEAIICVCDQREFDAFRPKLETA